MSKLSVNSPVDILTGITKSTRIAYVFWVFLGLFGGHRFYLGTPGTAVTQMILRFQY